MKRSWSALAWAAVCCFGSSSATAQSLAPIDVFETSPQPVSYSFVKGDCAAPACAADLECGAAGPSCGTGEAGCGSAGGCGGGCNNGCCGPLAKILGCCPLGEPLALKNHKKFNWGGWMQLGWQDRADGAFTGNGPFLSQKEWGRVNLNQLYGFVEKVADGSCGLDWGFRFDSYYGVDGNEGQAFGNVTPGHWDFLNGFDHGIYEIALPQAYGQVAYGKLSTKIGHFYTPVGYELVTSPGNFFLSRQLTFYHSEPFTHTGFYSTYTADDKFNFSGGWVYGMDSGFYQLNSASAFLGGLTWMLSDKVTFNYYMIGGNLGWRGQGAINSWITSVQWTKKFQTVHQFDVLGSDLRNGAGAPSTFQVDGIARNSTGFINYAFYALNDAVKAGSRMEWYKADGVSYYTWTNGFNIKPHANLNFRPEARYMWSNDSTTAGGLFADRMVWGCDMILTY